MQQSFIDKLLAGPIAKKILAAKDESLAKAQARYRAYFIKYKFYEAFKPAVDAILIEEGATDCIVTE